MKTDKIPIKGIFFALAGVAFAIGFGLASGGIVALLAWQSLTQFLNYLLG